MLPNSKPWSLFSCLPYVDFERVASRGKIFCSAGIQGNPRNVPWAGIVHEQLMNSSKYVPLLWRGVSRFSDRRIWPKKAHGLRIFAVYRADSWILKTQWIVDQLWILARIPDCACLNVRILGSKRNLDRRSFFSLGRYVKFIPIIYSLLFVRNQRWHSNLAVYLWMFTLRFPDVVVVLDLNKNICGSTDLAKKGTDRRICIPLFTPLTLVSNTRKPKFTNTLRVEETILYSNHDSRAGAQYFWVCSIIMGA